MTNSSSGHGPRGKVARLLDKYDFEDVGDFLVNRWTADNPAEHLSLRELAREFNIRLLKVRLTNADTNPIDGTAESYYRTLVMDDVSSGVRTRARRQLQQAGVDVDELMNEFVSRQAIHTYLTKTRSVSKPRSTSSISTYSVRESLNRLRTRVQQVATSRIERLREAGMVRIGEFRVLVDIQIFCSDCNKQQSLSKLLETGECSCDANPSEHGI